MKNLFTLCLASFSLFLFCGHTPKTVEVDNSDKTNSCCPWNIRNEVDCEFNIEYRITCPGGSATGWVPANLQPGSTSFPYIIQTNTLPMGCTDDCEVEVRIVEIYHKSCDGILTPMPGVSKSSPGPVGFNSPCCCPLGHTIEYEGPGDCGDFVIKMNC